jgi:hypothetical protein
MATTLSSLIPRASRVPVPADMYGANESAADSSRTNFSDLFCRAVRFNLIERSL